jgi:hypothetical protein
MSRKDCYMGTGYPWLKTLIFCRNNAYLLFQGDNSEFHLWKRFKKTLPSISAFQKFYEFQLWSPIEELLYESSQCS